jgi:hypothetical protein
VAAGTHDVSGLMRSGGDGSLSLRGDLQSRSRRRPGAAPRRGCG